MVLYSDIQFNPWQEFSHILPNGQNSRLADQLSVQEEIFKFCIENDADILIHNGDLFQALTEKIDKTTLLAAYDKFVEFSKEGVVVILIIGNHDWLDRTETAHILEPFKEIKNVIVVDKPIFEFLDEGIEFCFVPYTKMDFKAKIETLVKKRTPKSERYLRYLFTHQGVNGAKTGPRDFILKETYGVEDFRPDYFDLIFNGHYHKTQLFGANFIGVGSPLQKDFGERSDKKGFWFLDIEKSSRNPVFVETNAPKFYKIEIDKADKFKLPNDFTSHDFLWVICQDNSIYRIPSIMELGDRVRIDSDPEKVVKLRSDLSINMGIEEQIKRYVELTKTELDKERLVGMGIDKWKRSV